MYAEVDAADAVIIWLYNEFTFQLCFEIVKYRLKAEIKQIL